VVDNIAVCPNDRNGNKDHEVKWNGGNAFCLTCDAKAIAVPRLPGLPKTSWDVV
jgi:hypothetical protein